MLKIMNDTYVVTLLLSPVATSVSPSDDSPPLITAVTWVFPVICCFGLPSSSCACTGLYSTKHSSRNNANLLFIKTLFNCNQQILQQLYRTRVFPGNPQPSLQDLCLLITDSVPDSGFLLLSVQLLRKLQMHIRLDIMFQK